MMRVNSLLPSDASERMHPSAEPVPSMKRQVRQTRQERIPLRVISNEEGQQNMDPLNYNSEQKEPSPQTPMLDGDEEEQCFRSIAALLARENSAIKLGKMKSWPGCREPGDRSDQGVSARPGRCNKRRPIRKGDRNEVHDHDVRGSGRHAGDSDA